MESGLAGETKYPSGAIASARIFESWRIRTVAKQHPDLFVSLQRRKPLQDEARYEGNND